MKTASVFLIAAASTLLLFWYYHHVGHQPGGGTAPVFSANMSTEKTDASWHRRVLEVAEQYKSFGKVDEPPKPAPTLCRASRPPTPRLSRAATEQAHGKKLNYLNAQHRDSYLRIKPDDNEQPDNQVIVKEAWHLAADVSEDSTSPKTYSDADLGEPADLFMMLRTAAEDPTGEDGGVYATVSADRKTVTSLGTVQQCIECHQSAPHAGLFGLDYGRRQE